MILWFGGATFKIWRKIIGNEGTDDTLSNISTLLSFAQKGLRKSLEAVSNSCSRWMIVKYRTRLIDLLIFFLFLREGDFDAEKKRT